MPKYLNLNVVLESYLQQSLFKFWKKSNSELVLCIDSTQQTQLDPSLINEHFENVNNSDNADESVVQLGTTPFNSCLVLKVTDSISNLYCQGLSYLFFLYFFSSFFFFFSCVSQADKFYYFTMKNSTTRTESLILYMYSRQIIAIECRC